MSWQEVPDLAQCLIETRQRLWMTSSPQLNKHTSFVVKKSCRRRVSKRIFGCDEIEEFLNSNLATRKLYKAARRSAPAGKTEISYLFNEMKICAPSISCWRRLVGPARVQGRQAVES